MEIKQYFKIVIKRLWIIILIPVITSALTAYFSITTYKPSYSSNSTLYVIGTFENNQNFRAYSDIMVDQQLVKDYRELIKSRTVTGEVINGLRFKNITPEQLARKISVTSKNETRLINIEVIDNNAEMAMKITNKICEVFIKKATELLKVDNVSIIDIAKVNGEPIPSKIPLKIIIGFMVGFIMSIGIIFLIEYLDDTMKSTEDVEKYLGVTVLGTIPVLNIK